MDLGARLPISRGMSLASESPKACPDQSPTDRAGSSQTPLSTRTSGSTIPRKVGTIALSTLRVKRRLESIALWMRIPTARKRAGGFSYHLRAR